jgi:hypothetical protein
MHQDVAFFELLFDPIRSLIKIFGKIEPFVIFTRNVEMMRNILFGMV